MEDQAINALSTKTAPETSDQLLLVGAGEPQLIDYDKLADAILNKIKSKNYALDAGQMTLLAALNKLNSETSGKTFSITLRDNISANSFARCIVFGKLCLVYMNLYPKKFFNDGDILFDLSVSAKEMTFAAINSGLADSYIQVSENKIYYKGTQNSSRIRGEILFLVS